MNVQFSRKSAASQSNASTMGVEQLITTWSDYLVTDLNPHSILSLNGFGYLGSSQTADVQAGAHAGAAVDAVQSVEAVEAVDSCEPVSSVEVVPEFSLYPQGERLFNPSAQSERGHANPFDEWEDAVHYWVEECGCVQGFHLVSDCMDAFAGVSSRVVDYLHDEFPKRDLMCVPVTPPISIQLDAANALSAMSDAARAARHRRLQVHRAVNVAHSLLSMREYASAIVPLGLEEAPWSVRALPANTLDERSSTAHFTRHFDASSTFHSSAVLAAAFNTCSLPYRLKRGECSLADYTQALVLVPCRKLLTCAQCLPLPLHKHNQNLFDTLSAYAVSLQAEAQAQGLTSSSSSSLGSAGASTAPPPRPLTYSVSPCGTDVGERAAVRTSVLRGVCAARTMDARSNVPHYMRYRFQSPQQLLQQYGQDSYPGSVIAAHSIDDPLAMSFPFPMRVLAPDSELLQLSHLMSVRSGPLPSTSDNPSDLFALSSGALERSLNVRERVELPSLVEVANGPASARLLESVHSALADARSHFGSYSLESRGLERDQINEMLHALQSAADDYRDSDM